MSTKFIVNKVGGGVMTEKFIPLVLKQLRSQLKSGHSPIVVVSAVKGVTDSLLDFLQELRPHNARKGNLINDFVDGLLSTHAELLKAVGVADKGILRILPALKKHLEDLRLDLEKYAKGARSTQLEARIASYGERLSAVFFSAYLNSNNLGSSALLSENIPIVTNDNWKDANISYDLSAKNTKLKISNIKGIPVVSGFTGKTKGGDITVLGRGGTDTTACFVGAAVGAKKVVLWKDVAGVLSADPKIVKDARTIPKLSYAEVKESGKIVHGKSIQYLEKYRIQGEIAGLTDAKVKTVMVPTYKGSKGAKIASFKKNLTLFTLREGTETYEQLFEISKIFAYHKVGIVLLWNTPDSMQIVAEDSGGNVGELIADLKKNLKGISTEPVDMVALVGSFGWKDVNEFNRTLFTLTPDALTGAYPYPHCMRLEGIIRPGNLERVVRVLHEIFIK